MNTDCVFCNIQQKALPKHCIYENDRLFILLDKQSLGFGHSLIVPKLHISKIYDLDFPLYTDVFNIAKKLSYILLKAIEKNSIGYVAFGSGIQHAHLHLVPHDNEDVLIHPAKYITVLSEEELEKDSNNIRSWVSKLS